MAEIRVDADKAERMISQILRDQGGMLPAKANEFAVNICRRLTLAMAAPTSEVLTDYRVIRRHPPYGSDFAFEVAKIIADAKGDSALYPERLWAAVYDRGRDLPVVSP
ncbi:hypothetical protein ACVW1A_001338 [Bradyrhizobium sp. LB1.3]